MLGLLLGLTVVQPANGLERVVARIVTGESRSLTRRDWSIVGDAIAKDIHSLAPRQTPATWRSFPKRNDLKVDLLDWTPSEFGEPCAVCEILAMEGDEENNHSARFLVRKEHGKLRFSLLNLSQGVERVLPVNTGLPVLIRDRLALAGMGSNGTMRLSPVLQCWRQVDGRWTLVQTVLHDLASGNAYWAFKQGKPDPNHLVIEVPVTTPFSERTALWAQRSTRIEHWIYRGGRYRLGASYWLDDAFHAAEKFLSAIRSSRWDFARRFASDAVIKQLVAAGVRRRDYPYRFFYMSPLTIDLSADNWGSDPPLRLRFSRSGGRWRIAKVVPHCTAFDTMWSYGIRCDRAANAGKPEPPDPRYRG